LPSITVPVYSALTSVADAPVTDKTTPIAAQNVAFMYDAASMMRSPSQNPTAQPPYGQGEHRLF
jgi:hypothetical protein